jgi:hypothetical protein
MGLLSPNNALPTGGNTLNQSRTTVRRASTTTTTKDSSSSSSSSNQASNWNPQVTVMYDLYLQIGSKEKTFLQKGKCTISPSENIQTLLDTINEDNLTDYMATNFGGDDFMGAKLFHKNYAIAPTQIIDTLLETVFASTTQVDIVQMYRPKTAVATNTTNNVAYPPSVTYSSNDRIPSTYSYVNTGISSSTTNNIRRPSISSTTATTSTTTSTPTTTTTPTTNTVDPPLPKRSEKENNDLICFILCLAIFLFYNAWVGIFVGFVYFYSKSKSTTKTTTVTTATGTTTETEKKRI